MPLTINRVQTNKDWATLLINDIGAKPTNNNIQNILRWMAAENHPQTWATRNNPLNASLGTSKADGTGSYPDLTTAATNTANMIVGGYKGGAIGPGIYNALQMDAPPQDFSVAVVNSNWASNHYGVASAGADIPQPHRLADYISTIPVPHDIQASNAQPGTGAISSKATPASSKAIGCQNKGNIWHIPLTPIKWTACNRKAMVSGFIVTAGGLIMLTGTIMLFTGSRNPVTIVRNFGIR